MSSPALEIEGEESAPRASTAFQLSPCADSPASSSAIVIIPPEPIFDPEHGRLTAEIAAGEKSFCVLGAFPDSAHVESYATLLERELNGRELKRVTVVGIGNGANIAQAVAIAFPRIIRRVVLVDATTRLAPSRLVRLVDRIERVLPLGLPLRSSSTSFDSRPYLHRVRCPTLVVTTKGADGFTRAQSEIILATVPNAWHAEIDAVGPGLIGDELLGLIRGFLEVPAKRPQKNLGRVSA